MYLKYIDLNFLSSIELYFHAVDKLLSKLENVCSKSGAALCQWFVSADAFQSKVERIGAFAVLVHLWLERAFAYTSLPWSVLGSASVSLKFLGEAAVGFAAIKTSPLATKCLRRHKMRQSGNILCPGTPHPVGHPSKGHQIEDTWMLREKPAQQ